jgi:hypothetical protein
MFTGFPLLRVPFCFTGHVHLQKYRLPLLGYSHFIHNRCLHTRKGV